MQGMINDTVMSGENDDVTKTSSFGWLFSTITALGLLLFLAMSFAFYHRRLMIRKRKEAEYNRFFRFLRPDLEQNDKKITRARSILTNTHNPDLAFVESEVYHNEAFVMDAADFEDVDESDDHADNQISQNMINASDTIRTNGNSTENQNEESDLYMRSMQARRQVLLADVHSEEMIRESDNEVFKTIFSKRIQIKNNRIEERQDGLKELAGDYTSTFKNRNMLQIENHLSEPGVDDRTSTSYRKTNPDKPPLMKPITKVTIKDEIVMNKTIMKSTKVKKKKRGILARKSKGDADSLRAGSGNAPTFYSEPRRSSEPALFLYDEEPADPSDSKLYKNQNKILLNPYYTETSMPLNKGHCRRRSSTAEDAQEVDIFHKPNFNRERSMPVTDEIYEKHVPASTWM